MTKQSMQELQNNPVFIEQLKGDDADQCLSRVLKALAKEEPKHKTERNKNGKA